MRLEACLLQSGIDLPYAALRRQIGAAIGVVVHLERRHGLRRVAEVIHVCGYDAANESYDTHALNLARVAS